MYTTNDLLIRRATMPLIQVTAPQNALNKPQQDTLMSRISNAVLTAEGAPLADPGAQSLVWAYYQEQPVSKIYVGGENLGQPPFRIDVTTPQGALTEAARGALVKALGDIVDDIVGHYEGRLNHWAMLYEVDEGSWAGGGQVFPLAGIQAAMNIKAA
jgi:phenylpyruvate tautomerase PptA (4-oxalocrotonate tautomerase family)